MPVTDISTTSLLQRAVRNARSQKRGRHARWVAVKDAFVLGSTYAYELCQLVGEDPEELTWGDRCEKCESKELKFLKAEVKVGVHWFKFHWKCDQSEIAIRHIREAWRSAIIYYKAKAEYEGSKEWDDFE